MHSFKKNISSTGAPSSAAMGNPRVLIAAGGTGGHVYPAIAIADSLKESRDALELLFVGTKNRMEWRTVPKAGYKITSIWISGFHRRFTLKNLLFPIKLLSGIVQSYNIISRFNPDVVICCGGFVSGPVGWVAAVRGIPLVLQEQNSYPGVTNRLLGRMAELIFTAFEEADNYLPKDKTRLVGNPVRKDLLDVDEETAYELFDFSSERKTLLVLGGSGGAKSINNAMAHNVEDLLEDLNLQVIWQSGKKYYDICQRAVEGKALEHLRLKDYIEDMPEAYAVADLVVSRAGAISCSELALTGKPSVLVPSPNVAGDHQAKNAAAMEKEGAAVILNDSELEKRLCGVVEEIIFDDERLEEMKIAAKSLSNPKASEEIANDILELISVRRN